MLKQFRATDSATGADNIFSFLRLIEEVELNEEEVDTISSMQVGEILQIQSNIKIERVDPKAEQIKHVPSTLTPMTVDQFTTQWNKQMEKFSFLHYEPTLPTLQSLSLVHSKDVDGQEYFTLLEFPDKVDPYFAIDAALTKMFGSEKSPTISVIVYALGVVSSGSGKVAVTTTQLHYPENDFAKIFMQNFTQLANTGLTLSVVSDESSDNYVWGTPIKVPYLVFRKYQDRTYTAPDFYMLKYSNTFVGS